MGPRSGRAGKVKGMTGCLAVAALLTLPAQAEEGSFLNPVISRTLEADDIDVAVWTKRLARLGIRLPVSVSGKINGKLFGRVPLRSATDAKAWTLKGSIKSPKLTVEGTPLRDLNVSLTLDKGVLTLSDLSFRPGPVLPGKQRPPIRGSGTLPVDPTGPATLRLKLQEFDLRSLSPRVEAVGTVTATIDAIAPADRLTDVLAWTAEGPITLRGVTLSGNSSGDLPPVDLDGRLKFKDRVASLGLDRLKIEGLEASGDAAVTVAGALPITATVDAVLDGDRVLTRLLGERPAVQLDGPARVVGSLKGTLTPLEYRFEGSVATVEETDTPVVVTLASLPLTIDGGRSGISYDGSTLKLRDADFRAFGGAVRGQADISLAKPPGDSRIDVTATGLDPQRLSSLIAVDEQFARFETATAPVDVTADLLVPESEWKAIRGYRGDVLLSTSLAGGRMQARVQATDDSVVVRVRLAEADLASVAAIPGFLPTRFRNFQGVSTLDLRGRLWPDNRWQVDATADAKDFTLATLSGSRLSAHIKASPDLVSIAVDGDAAGGTLELKATVETQGLTPQLAGELTDGAVTDTSVDATAEAARGNLIFRAVTRLTNPPAAFSRRCPPPRKAAR